MYSCVGFLCTYLTLLLCIVDWSVKGKLVAVARKSVISILSSKFRVKLSMSLSLNSLIGDSELDVNCTIKGNVHAI